MSADAAGHHEHHWEWSWAPTAVVIGTFLLVPLGFSAYFVYENMLLTTIFTGVGTPILLIGIAKWVSECLTQEPIVEGLGATALPIFIVSEVFIFLGLFASYWLMRLSAGEAAWPPEGTPQFDLVLPIIMTVILVASSITYHVAEVKYENKDMGGFRTWLILTLILGFVFLGMTFYEYSHLLHADFGPSTNAFSTAFFTITGFHASHVLVGLGTFIAILLPAFKGKSNHIFVSAAGVYWHFVDVVWFFVVSQLYYW